MRDLKTEFMIALSTGTVCGPSTSAFADRIEQYALELMSRCTPAVAPVTTIAGPLTERDHAVLHELARHSPLGAHGLKASQWKALCARIGVGRRAWESSVERLIAAGKATRDGTRYAVANNPAV